MNPLGERASRSLDVSGFPPLLFFIYRYGGSVIFLFGAF